MEDKRHNFTKATIEILAKRVGYLCSNPQCRKPTIGPNEKNDKSTTIGQAAHITAASEGGPRYDASITTEQRRHINNGIWLCSNCATLIDKDPDEYPVKTLLKWKEEAEEECRKKLLGEKFDNTKESPFLEVDLIWTFGGRKNRGFSNKNPVTVHNGKKIYDVTNKPIVFWGLFWNFDFVIYNNSQSPAYNIKIESVGNQHFTHLDKLPRVNNLPPLMNLDLNARYEDFIEGNHLEADEILKSKIPDKFKYLKLKLIYYDDERNSHVNYVEFTGTEILNKKIE